MALEHDPSTNLAEVLSHLEIGEYNTADIPVSPNIPLTMTLTEYDQGWVGFHNLINTVFDGIDSKVVTRITNLAEKEYFDNPECIVGLVESMLDKDGKPKVLTANKNKAYLEEAVEGAEAIAPDGYTESGQLKPLVIEEPPKEPEFAEPPTWDYEVSGISEQPRDHTEDEKAPKENISPLHIVAGALKKVIPERRATPRREYYVQTEAHGPPIHKSPNQMELEQRALKALRPFEQLMALIGLADGPEGEEAYKIVLADIEAKKAKLAEIESSSKSNESVDSIEDTDPEDLQVFKFVSQPRKTTSNIEVVDDSEGSEDLEVFSFISDGSIKTNPVNKSTVRVSSSNGLKVTKQGATISVNLKNRGKK